MTRVNVAISIFSVFVFILNQLCNLRFFALWSLWHVTGFLFALLLCPFCLIFSFVTLMINIDQRYDPQKRKKYLTINTVCFIVALLFEIAVFNLHSLFTWA